MKKMIVIITLFLIPIISFAQMIDNFDSAPTDTAYWGHEISENADSTLSFINESYITDPISEGTGAIKLEYSGHNIESWGGYAKLYHYAREPLPPDTTG